MAARATGTLLAGRYRVVRLLGRGGAATVLLARDERLGRLVAVKRLHADSPSEMAARFDREARLGASLNHPNLVAVFDTVTDEDGVLIVTEYVAGMTLREQLRAARLETGRAIGVVRDVAAALDHAHGHGVVHRDVKPANILLRDDGAVKLVDLGIATALEQTRITRSGTVLGTAAYMAPEQLEGGRVGPGADVYALAAVAFEALSGRKPRTGRTALEIAHRIATEPPPDLREAWGEAPPAAAEVLRRGMARAVKERPPSAGALAADLEQSLRPPAEPPPPVRPAPAEPPPPVRPAPVPAEVARTAPRGDRRMRAPRRRWAALAALAIAVGALAMALAGGLDGGEEGPGRGSVHRRQPSQEPAGGERGAGGAVRGGGARPAPAPSGGAEGATGVAEGRRLNDQGFALMRQGRYGEAVPILRRAVDAFPRGSQELTYAYALYNLGRSLRLFGRPGEAIPILEQRLRIPNQSATVRRELEAARREAATRSAG